jgi:tetratricopeptide (TPR) repeat protein
MSACPLPARLVGCLIALLLLGSFGAASPAQGQLSIRFDLQDNAKVSDTVTLTARVRSEDDTGIEKVEFYLGDQLVATDTSTPYTYEWDTLQVAEGSYTFTVRAYDAKNNAASAKLTLVVDNELSRGADFHADAALAALKEGKTADAVRFARRALKIAPSNLRAARALAGIYRQQRELGRAIEVLERAEIPPDDVETRADLVALYINAGENAGSTEAFLDQASKAVEVYAKLQEARKLRQPSGGDAVSAAIARGDAYFAARNWDAAIREYQRAGSAETAPMEALNRLLLAYINAGRRRDAETLLRVLTNFKRADDVTTVIRGLMLYNTQEFAKAQQTLKPMVEKRMLSALIVSGYLHLVLKQSRQAQMMAEQAQQIAPDLPEVHLLRAYVLTDSIDSRRALLRAQELDPLLPEAYAMRAYQILLTSGSRRFASADALFEFALKRDPQNVYAMLGYAASLMAQRRPNEAEPLVNRVVEMQKEAPDALVAQALNFSLLDKPGFMITNNLNAAMKADDERWNDVFVPKPLDLVQRIYRYRYAPSLTPASLYPAQRQASAGR